MVFILLKNPCLPFFSGGQGFFALFGRQYIWNCEGIHKSGYIAIRQEPQKSGLQILALIYSDWQ
jgi:hypothetical protein